jgi:hypothetical protein
MLNYLFLLFVSLNKIKKYSYIFMGNIAGYDNRNITLNNEKINIKNLTVFFHKKNILKKLESCENSINTKIDLIIKEELKIPNEKSIKPINIWNGGLLKQWNFEL